MAQQLELQFNNRQEVIKAAKEVLKTWKSSENAPIDVDYWTAFFAAMDSLQKVLELVDE